MKLKSHFFLDSRQRSGILLFVLILVLSWLLYFSRSYFWTPEQISDVDLENFELQIDSLRKLKVQELEEKPKIYPFNPNYITDYKGYTLGMSPEEIDKLLRFREKNEWINSAEDFQKVTGVSDSLLAVLSPYFKFPEWVTKREQKPSAKKANEEQAPVSDLNTAGFQELMAVSDISDELAKRILSYRKRLGGFLEDNQLYDVYGLSSVQVRALKTHFTVLTKPDIEKLNVNTANASDLATNPYITFEIARDIIDYRTLHEGVSNLDDLLKIDGITAYKLDRIKLYLSTNQN